MNAQRTTPTKGKTLGIPAALAQTPLDLFAPVYRGCAQNGVDALAVDEMEVWQVASTLGIGMDDTGSTGAGSDGPPAPGDLSRGRRAS